MTTTDFLTRGIGAFSQNPQFIKAEGYNLQIGADWYRTVAGPGVQVQLATRDSLAERVDQNASIYQNVLDIGMAWGRTDVSGGEGLDWDPRQIALDTQQATLDPIRYWDSVGLDISRPESAGDPYQLKLARGQTEWGGTVTDPKDLAASNLFIYIADGDTITWYDSWDNLTPVGSDTPVLDTDIVAMAAAPNDTVMVTLEDGDIWVKDPDAIVFVLAYNSGLAAGLPAQGIWYLQGRFLSSLFDTNFASELIELVFDGTNWESAPLVVDTASGPFWSVVESGPAIVAACADGTVRTYTPDNANDGDMALHPRGRTTMPEGEQPILLGSNAGVLLIMTTADHEQLDLQEIRMYQSEVLDARFDFVVGSIQLRRQWVGAEHEPLVTRNMTTTRDTILWFVKEFIDGAQFESLWKMDVVTGGFSRLLSASEVNYNAVHIFQEIAAAIDFQNIRIMLSKPGERQTFGWMIFPNITFGLNTDLTWLTSVVEVSSLEESGAQVELWRSVDPDAIRNWQHPSWVLVQRLSSPGASGTEISLANVKSRTLALQLRVRATNNDSVSPKVTRTAIRAIPAHRDFIMVVPVNVSDYVSAPGRMPVRIPGLGHTLNEALLDTVGKAVEAFLLEPTTLFRGIVNNVSEPVEFISDRGSVTRYCMVEFRGTRLTATATATGDSGMGAGLLGIATIGIGQSQPPEETP